MLYYELEIDSKVYKLRLNTRNIVTLEKMLGCNPLAIFGLDENEPQLPTVTQMVSILFCSLQQYQHNITLDNTYDIFDSWLRDKAPTDFMPHIMEIYKVSGIIKEEKN